MKVVILQGIPGSGKSSYAASLPGEVVICSADHYFLKDGKYKFDRFKLPEAHASCMRTFVETVRKGGDVTVVVDNTNPTINEVLPYYVVAKAYNAKIQIVTLHCNPEVGADRNIHGVSLHECQVMADKIASFAIPGYWDVMVTKII